jgi:hypothetical protein
VVKQPDLLQSEPLTQQPASTTDRFTQIRCFGEWKKVAMVATVYDVTPFSH